MAGSEAEAHGSSWRTPSAHDGEGPSSAGGGGGGRREEGGFGAGGVLVAGSGSLPHSQTKAADVRVAAGGGRSSADESQTDDTPPLIRCNLPV